MVRSAAVVTSVVVGVALAAITLPAVASAKARLVCGSRASGRVRCHAEVVTNAHGRPVRHAAPTGLAPEDLQQAYGLPSLLAGDGQVIGIVDAYDDPEAARDLATYRARFGLPPCGAPCLRIVDERGGTALPRANAGWAGEISLDLDMASATCPNCALLLVEADSSSLDDLGAAQDTAAALGATVISDSFGGPESAGEVGADVHFHHAGIATVASSGDDGFGTSYPAASPSVIAVGGTSLKRSRAARGFSETAWTRGGSGCSTMFARPAWQATDGCAGRSVADVSAVADPATGVAIYDSHPMGGPGGWLVMGGTSASAPIIAGVIALAGNAAALADGAAPAYAATGSFTDVRRGANGTCAPKWLCHAGAGYDGPTGLGTPVGVGGL